MENENVVSRRAVLCGLAVLALGAVPDSAIASGNVSVLANGKTEVLLSSNPALKKVGGVVQFQDKNGRELALVRTGSGASAFKAIDLSCTHNGVTVAQSGSEWLCPAHGSKFALDGKLKSGLAKRSLQTVPFKVSGTKVVVG
jgi:Rieske Fe-S protein